MNCLTYAVSKWLREGGYLLIRRSHFAEVVGIENKWNPLYWIPHFLHRSKDKIITQYTPTESQKRKDKQKGLFAAFFSLFHFEGEIIGDDEE